MQKVKLPDDVLIREKTDEVANENSVIFSEGYVETLLAQATEQGWPDLSKVQGNEFATFVATSFQAAEVITNLCDAKFKEFVTNPGADLEETRAKLAKVLAFFNYTNYLVDLTYRNHQMTLDGILNQMIMSVQKKEDPNAELN